MCQRAHWPTHKGDCAVLHELLEELQKSDSVISGKRKADDDVDPRGAKRLKQRKTHPAEIPNPFVSFLSEASADIIFEIIKHLGGNATAALGNTARYFAEILRNTHVALSVLEQRYGEEAMKRNSALTRLIASGQSWRALEYAATLTNAWGAAASTVESVNVAFPLPDDDDLVYAVASAPANGPVFVWTRTGIWVYTNVDGQTALTEWIDKKLNIARVLLFEVVGDKLIAVYYNYPSTKLPYSTTLTQVRVAVIDYNLDTVITDKILMGTDRKIESSIAVAASPSLVCLFMIRTPDPSHVTETIMYSMPDFRQVHSQVAEFPPGATEKVFSMYDPSVDIDKHNIICTVNTSDIGRKYWFDIIYDIPAPGDNFSDGRHVMRIAHSSDPKLTPSNYFLFAAAGNSVSADTSRNRVVVEKTKTSSLATMDGHVGYLWETVNQSPFADDPVQYRPYGASIRMNVGWCMGTNGGYGRELYVWAIPSCRTKATFSTTHDDRMIIRDLSGDHKSYDVSTAGISVRTTFDGERFITCESASISKDRVKRECQLRTFSVWNTLSEELRRILAV